MDATARIHIEDGKLGGKVSVVGVHTLLAGGLGGGWVDCSGWKQCTVSPDAGCTLALAHPPTPRTWRVLLGPENLKELSGGGVLVWREEP